MNGLRRTFSFRKKSKKRGDTTDSSKPQQWLDDEAKIKDGCCSFQVKYLGNIEVYESRGMQVCEEAIKALRKSKKKPQKAILYVSGDALRVSDDVSQHLIVDQTIEKVSFCAPDRSHEKGFAYICRDGATRRWMCHAFLAVKESGERLSHAVGCAFAICLEKKQKRERDALQLATSEDRSFTRVGSFRPASLVERLIDPQSTMLTEPWPSSGDTRHGANGVVQTQVASSTPASPVTLVGAIPRPRPSPSITDRQGSLRLFPKLQDVSPFKRDLSLRLEELPSNLQRLARITNGEVIPEETGTEVDESLSKMMTSTNTRSGTATPAVQPAGSPEVSRGTGMDELMRFSPTGITAGPNLPTSSFTGTSTGLMSAGVGTLSPSTTTTALTPSFLTDPFSAAPFNPATIQQHQAHLLSAAEPTTSEAATTQLSVRTMTAVTTTVDSSAPTSPFLGGPPIAAPRPAPSLTTSPWQNGSLTQYSNPLTAPGAMLPMGPGVPISLAAYQQPGSPQLALAYPPYQTSVAQTAFGILPYSSAYAVPWSSAANAMMTPASSAMSAVAWPTPVTPTLLPPEPDRLADPFDVGWADRATAAFNSSAVINATPITGASFHKPGNPFVSNDPVVTAASDTSSVHVNGHSTKTDESPIPTGTFS